MKRKAPHAEHVTGSIRKKKVRAAIGLAITAGLIIGLGACSSSGDSGTSNKITLQLWDTDTRPDRTANIKTLISMFEKKNPDISIEYLGLPTDSYMQKISTAIATKSTPDLLTPKASDIGALVGQDALAPLDDRMAKAGLNKQIAPDMLKSSKVASPDGKLYLTPATSLADVIYYRSDWFAEKGLSAPKSWDDFYADADALTDKSAGRFGYTLRGGDGFFAPFISMVYTQAGISTLFSKDGTSTLDDPAIVAAAEKYVSLYNKDTAQSDLTAEFKAVVANFDNGGAAMLSHSIGSYPTHVAALGTDKIGAAVPFTGTNDKTVLTGRMPTGFAMFKASEHQDAAWKFLAFTMSHKGDSFWAEKSGYIPGNLQAAKDPWVAKNPAIQVAIDATKLPNVSVLQLPYYLPEYTTITNTQAMPEWQRVLQGDLSVKKFLTDTASKLTDAQKKYMASKK